MKELFAAGVRIDRGALPVFPREAKKFERPAETRKRKCQTAGAEDVTSEPIRVFERPVTDTA